jgi:protein-disulfide isomerase
MKNWLMYLLLALLGGDVAIQGLNVYRQRSSRPATVSRAPSGTILDISSYPIQGTTDAKTIIAEFSDFECPFCTQYATGVYPQLKERLVTAGKVRYAFVNEPLPIHPSARVLAQAALCAANQDRFWEVHDIFFKKKPRTSEDAEEIAQDLGLDMARYRACLSDPQTDNDIERDLRQAQRLGLDGTPSFAIGTLDSANKLVIHSFIRGAQSLETFEKEIAGAASRTTGS